MMLRSCCLRYFGQRNGDALLWHTDLKPHASGEFSIVVVQANSNLEDQSQVYTSPSATYVGVYDGHGGPEASRFVNRHLFLYLHRTNFQCFATAGDGSIVVGSIDGKIRLYSRTSMRLAKTAFPGLGSPITSVDVTYDGKWVLGTTDTYLILICTLFTDKDGRTKTGFSGRMGNKIPAPRLLKLTPVDAHLAGADNKFHAGHFSWQVKNSEHHCYQNQQGLKSCYCYKIVLKDESIIESRFMHDKFALGSSPEAPLVVATSMKVSSFSMSGKR